MFNLDDPFQVSVRTGDINISKIHTMQMWCIYNLDTVTFEKRYGFGTCGGGISEIVFTFKNLEDLKRFNKYREEEISRVKGHITNKDLLREIRLSKQDGAVTSYLCKYIETMLSNYIKRANFRDYIINSIIYNTVLTNTLSVALRFDNDKSDNPFAFYTQIIRHNLMKEIKNAVNDRI